jgi:hypothetical protein
MDFHKVTLLSRQKKKLFFIYSGISEFLSKCLPSLDREIPFSVEATTKSFKKGSNISRRSYQLLKTKLAAKITNSSTRNGQTQGPNWYLKQPR